MNGSNFTLETTAHQNSAVEPAQKFWKAPKLTSLALEESEFVLRFGEDTHFSS